MFHIFDGVLFPLHIFSSIWGARFADSSGREWEEVSRNFIISCLQKNSSVETVSMVIYIYIYCNQQTLFIVYTYIFRVEFKSLCWDYVESILFIMTFIILYITFIMTFIRVSTTSPFLLYLNFFVWNSGIIILPCKVLYAIRYWQVIRVKFFHLMFTYRDCTLW